MAGKALAAASAAGLKSNVVYVPHPSASPAQIAEAEATGAATPLYTADPAPMGLADYGLGNTYPEVYVANSGSNTVSVLSDPTNAVVATIPVQDDPVGIAYSSDNGEVYVANEESNTVSVISGTSVAATIPVGDEPYAVAYDSGNGELFVANSGSNNVSVISDLTNQVVATVGVGTTPTGAVYDPLDNDVYVANLDFTGAGGSVSVISASTNTLATTISAGLGDEPYDPTFDSDNGDVYVTDLVSGTVSVISAMTVIATISVGANSEPRDIVFDPENGQLFVALVNEAAVSVIDGAMNSVVTQIPVGDDPVGIAFDTNDGEAYVTNTFSDNVSVIDGATNAVVGAVPVGGSPWAAAFDNGSGAGAVTPSVLNTSAVSGTISISEPGIQGQDLYQNTPDAFSLQLNGVLTNVDIMGNYDYTYWAQDIVTYYPSTGTMVLITNVWNFSAPMSYMDNSTIFAHGIDGTGQYSVLGFYYAEYTVPYAVSYPFSATLSMSTEIGSLGPDEYDEVVFSTTVSSPSSAFPTVEEPAWDFVAFNSPSLSPCPCSTGPTSPLQFTVDPVYNAVGLLDDVELVVSGPGGGSNVDLGTADASLGLEYWNAALDAYSDIPAAYNYGSDTGETSMNANVDWTSDAATSPNGFSDYATMTTGPSVMSGLWGTGAAVGTGELLLNVSPSNAFVFVHYTGTAAWSQTIVPQQSYVPSLQTNEFDLMPGNYEVTVELSDWTTLPSFATSFTISASDTTVYVNLMSPDSAVGVVTPLWASSNSQLRAIAQSGSGTPSSPYVLFNNPLEVDGQVVPLDPIFGVLNDYAFPVYPGVFLLGTTDSVELNNSPSFEVNDTAFALGETNEPATPYQSLPGVNELQLWFWNVSGVALTNDTNISGWFADQASLPLSYNTFNVIFYNSANDLVANDTFATASEGLLIYSSGLGSQVSGSTTVWGNRFIQIAPADSCTGPAACDPLFPYNGGLGLELGQNDTLVYNNVFDTPTTAWELPLNLYTGEPVTYVDDAWNVISQAATDVAYAAGFPGIPLTGSIVGGTTQGGNSWWDYGVADNFANGADNPLDEPYIEDASTLISGSATFPCPTPYYCASYLYPPGDEAPLTPAGEAVTFTPQGIASGSVWGALVSCNVGETQKNSGGGGTQKNSGGGGPPVTICCPGGTQKNSGGGGTQKNSGGGGPPGCGGTDPPPSILADFETSNSYFELVLPQGEFNWTPNVPGGYTSTTGGSFVVPPNVPDASPGSIAVTVPYAGAGAGVATFTETGLVAGLSWQVTVAGSAESLTTDGGADSVFFTESNGNYAYSVAPETGYLVSPNPPSGSVTVASGPVTVDFEYTALALSVSPAEGPVGTVATVTGSGFTASTPLSSLVFDGVEVSSCTTGSLTPSSSGDLSCGVTVLSTMSGTSVVATDSSGRSEIGIFTITTLSLQVVPSQGPVGAAVTVSGTGFSVSIALQSLVFDGVKVSSCTSGSLVASASGSFTCALAVPKGTTSTTVVATNAGGMTASASFTVTSLALAVVPGLGPIGASVTVSGSGFSTSTALRSLVFDGVKISSCATGSLSTTASGSFDCTLSVPAGTTSSTVTATDVGGQTASGSFLVTTPIIVVLPGQGPIGAAVVLAGAGFSVSSPVGLVFDGVKVSACTAGSLTTSSLGLFVCSFKVPSGTSSTTVAVTDAGGQQGTARFTVTTPRITVSPAQGPVGATVTVSGTGFSVLSPVRLVFDGVTVSSCAAGSLATGAGGTFGCTVKVPAHTSGTTVTATDVGGQSAVGSFTVTVPAIALSATQGAPGATVTITGTGFSASSTVRLVFDGVSVTSCTSGSLTTSATGAFSCTLKVPSKTSGTSVTVTDPGGQVASGKYTVT